MENGINFFRGKDDINYFLNGRQPHVKKWKTTLKRMTSSISNKINSLNVRISEQADFKA